MLITPAIGIRPIKRALWAANYFHLLDALSGQWRQIEPAAEIVQFNSVNHHQVVIRISSANEGARNGSATSRLIDFNARQAPHHFHSNLCSAIGNFFRGDNAHRGRNL